MLHLRVSCWQNLQHTREVFMRDNIYSLYISWFFENDCYLYSTIGIIVCIRFRTSADANSFVPPIAACTIYTLNDDFINESADACNFRAIRYIECLRLAEHF